MTESFLVFPDPPPNDLVRFLDSARYSWTASSGTATPSDADVWTAAIVDTSRHPGEAWRFCEQLKNRNSAVEPILVLVASDQLNDLATHADHFDDFMAHPFDPFELGTRLRLLVRQLGHNERPEVLSYGPLTINVETYQAEIAGKAMDLTFMEYELLKYLTSSPGRVFDRETLLSNVWGYEYFGGARTVDVHIRRLRTKLGEEHAHLIQTVRSVGYKLGQARK